MNSITARLNKLENGVIAGCFIVMSLAAFAQVVNRNLIGAGISWFDELARYCMVYMTLLATEAGLRDGSQISITAVTEKCPPVVKRILQILVKLIIIGFSICILTNSFTLIAKQIRSGQVSAGLNLPMWIPYSALPVAFGIITVVQIIMLFMLLKSPLPEKTTGKTATHQADGDKK